MCKVNQLILTTEREIDGLEIYEQSLVVTIVKFIRSETDKLKLYGFVAYIYIKYIVILPQQLTHGQ
jgi:hypothetical protein